jgi:hypothetical protein
VRNYPRGVSPIAELKPADAAEVLLDIAIERKRISIGTVILEGNTNVPYWMDHTHTMHVRSHARTLLHMNTGSNTVTHYCIQFQFRYENGPFYGLWRK